MARQTRSGWHRGVAIAVVVCLSPLIAAPGQDEKSRPTVANAGSTPIERYTAPAEECNRCHAHPESYAQELRNHRLVCNMTEGITWTANDPHKNAYKALLGARGQRMAEALSKADGGHAFDARKKESGCLGCHSTPVEGIDPSLFDYEANGVSCVVCHGTGREWIAHHPFKEKQWRDVSNTRKVKDEKFGMTNLWDPVTRAEVCASCHIGKVDKKHPEKNKVLTHAMFAAGHPPLPGFEVATFGEYQPRHWDSLRQKRDKPVPDYNPAKRERTEQVAVSGLVGLRAAARLFAQADDEAPRALAADTASWPDFARYDCYACHHDLQRPSWRQVRGYGTAPGRIPAPSWPEALVKVGIVVADPAHVDQRAGEYGALLKSFQEAVGARPFGDLAKARPAARALADWADGLLAKARDRIAEPSQVGVDQKGVLTILHMLCREAQNRWDYDSARQVAWAFRTIYEECRDFDPGMVPDPKVPEILNKLDEHVGLTLRPKGHEGVLEELYADRMKMLDQYRPDAFHALFTELVEHLPDELAGTR